MLKVEVTIGGDFGQSLLADLGKQTRYAAAVALTRTAWEVARAEQREVDRAFDRPTPFTRKAFGVTRATPANLTAEVFIKPRQAEYLRTQIEGGRRSQTRFEQRLGESRGSGYWVPGQGVKLNSYGNLSLAQLKSIADGLRKSGKFADTFIGRPRGHAEAPFGIWARPKRGKSKGVLKPLLIRIDAPGYRKRFAFYDVGKHTVDATFAGEFDKALTQALATAR